MMDFWDFYSHFGPKDIGTFAQKMLVFDEWVAYKRRYAALSPDSTNQQQKR